MKLTNGEFGYLVGAFVGFMVGSSLTLAICLTFGNAFPEPW